MTNGAYDARVSDTPTLVLLFVLAGFATARMTRFLSDDILAGPIRKWWKRRIPGRLLKQLITCPWCLSIWLSPTAVIAYLVSPGQMWHHYMFLFVVPTAMLTISYLTGLAASIADHISLSSDKAEAQTALFTLQANEISRKSDLAHAHSSQQD